MSNFPGAHSSTPAVNYMRGLVRPGTTGRRGALKLSLKPRLRRRPVIILSLSLVVVVVLLRPARVRRPRRRRQLPMGHVRACRCVPMPVGVGKCAWRVVRARSGKRCCGFSLFFSPFLFGLVSLSFFGSRRGCIGSCTRASEVCMRAVGQWV